MYENPDENRHIHAKRFPLFKISPSYAWKTYPLFLISRIRAYLWKITPFFAKVGTRVVYVLIGGGGILIKLLQHISGVFCQKQVWRAWTSNYIPQILCDVITCPCTSYLLLAQHSSFEDRVPAKWIRTVDFQKTSSGCLTDRAPG